jgi:hypothetical protein
MAEQLCCVLIAKLRISNSDLMFTRASHNKNGNLNFKIRPLMVIPNTKLSLAKWFFGQNCTLKRRKKGVSTSPSFSRQLQLCVADDLGVFRFLPTTMNATRPNRLLCKTLFFQFSLEALANTFTCVYLT